MSDKLTKVRIELLDENTGVPISEVDALTSSETILYTNDKATVVEVGSIEKGTVFNKTPLSDILDGVLYPYAKPSIYGITTGTSDIPGIITEDTRICKNVGETVAEFQYNVAVVCGSSGTLTCTMTIYHINGTTSKKISMKKDTVTGESYNFTYSIPNMDETTSIDAVIFDGKNYVQSPLLTYEFTDPIFVGFAPHRLLSDTGDLIDKNLVDITAYFNEVISKDTLYMDKRLITKSDQRAFVTDLDYDHKADMNPCILVPEYWGNPLGVIDMNGLNITRSYSIIRLDLEVRENHTVNYILYMSRETFDTNSTILKDTTYRFIKEDDEVIPEASELCRGIPITSRFEPQDDFPLDSRLVVNKYEDLLGINHPYNGLICYVKDIDTFFRHKQPGGWLPTSTRVYVTEDASTLTSSFGGWDDVGIVTNGEIYRKRYNNVWELWGTIQGSGGGGGTTPAQQMRFNPSYSEEQAYSNTPLVVDLVYHKGSTYYCLKSCVGIEPSDDGEYWTYFAKGGEGSLNNRDIRFYNSSTDEYVSSEDVIVENVNNGNKYKFDELTLVEDGE